MLFLSILCASLILVETEMFKAGFVLRLIMCFWRTLAVAVAYLVLSVILTAVWMVCCEAGDSLFHHQSQLKIEHCSWIFTILYIALSMFLQQKFQSGVFYWDAGFMVLLVLQKLCLSTIATRSLVHNHDSHPEIR